MSDSRRSSSSAHAATSGVKNKWIKAFRSLRLTTVGSGSRSEASERQHANASRFIGLHAFQEYTYKKITACDVCREILRGHSRQGLKCKLCKMNVHTGTCQENAPKCQPKPRLLRKQKSASELEMKLIVPAIEDEKCQNYDPVYRSLKEAADARKSAQYGSDNYIVAHPYEEQQGEDIDNERKVMMPTSSKSKKSSAGNNNSGNGSRNGSSNNVNIITSSGHGKTSNSSSSSNYLEMKDPMPSGSGSGNNNNVNNNNVNTVPATTMHHMNHHQMPEMQMVSSVHVREPEEYHHHYISLQTRPPPNVQQSSYCYNQHQQQQPPQPQPQQPYPTMGPMPNNCGNNHESLRTYIKQNNPAFLSIAQSSQQAYSAPHSPQKKKLTLRMKSLSLDSPESQETLKDKRTMGGQATCASSSNTPPYEAMAEIVNYKYKAPQVLHSPGMSKRFKLHGRMCSFEDPMNDIPASMSPCPSPKPQRLLPPNIFVVLYNFRSRQSDELNLRAGYIVTVIDTTDPEWWQGKCLGKVGYFPSKYVTKLFPGERPLQVIHTVQVNDGEFVIKLLREQIVIQVSEEVSGMIMVRPGTNDNIVACPAKYLQEITI